MMFPRPSISDMTIGILSAIVFSVTAIGTLRTMRAADSMVSLHQAPAALPAASRVIWDGVYSEAQQKRGETIYGRECSTCHGETLKGGEGAPALTGADFSAHWDGQTVADLFDKIRLTMPAPPEQPGKLTPPQDADVVAHILSANSFPAGTTELSTEIAQLKRIRMAFKP